MANEYQDINLNARHKGKLSMTGELSIPELADLVTPPLGENAIGMKSGITYKWNRITGAWEPLGGGMADAEVTTPTDSDTLTVSYMNTNFPDKNSVVFTNLTNYPQLVAMVQRYAGGWYLNLYGNKLT